MKINGRILSSILRDQQFADKDYSISTDTRSYKNEDLLICLKGERYDGFEFLEDVSLKPSSIVLFNNTNKNLKFLEQYRNQFPEVIFIKLENTLSFLQNIGLEKRRKWNGVVIGITGSNGKTSTKNFLVQILKSFMPELVHGTYKNFNNYFGIPFTLLDLSPKHKICVLEMGINQKDEMEGLVAMSEPDHAIITSIGYSHIEFLESKQGVFKEKIKLFKNIKSKDAFFVADIDSVEFPAVKEIKNLKRLNSEILIQKKSQYEYILQFNDDTIVVKNSRLTGEHNWRNLALAYAMAVSLYPQNLDDIKRALQSCYTSDARSEWIEIDGHKVFLDSYNSNPSSLNSALLAFKESAAGKSLIIIGEMRELGKNSEKFHEQAGEYINELNFRDVVFIGNFSSSFGAGFKSEFRSYSSVDEFLKSSGDNRFGDFDSVFIKGSNSLHLERIVQ